jgi:hypothetical protein
MNMERGQRKTNFTYRGMKMVITLASLQKQEESRMKYLKHEKDKILVSYEIILQR